MSSWRSERISDGLLDDRAPSIFLTHMSPFLTLLSRFLTLGVGASRVEEATFRESTWTSLTFGMQWFAS